MTQDDIEKMMINDYGYDNDEKTTATVKGTFEICKSDKYIYASINRGNQKKLRAQYLILDDPIKGGKLDNNVFSGADSLYEDQYVLVRLNENVDEWDIYQGQGQKGNPKPPQKKFESVSLKSFFDNKLTPIDEDCTAKMQCIYYGVPGCGKSYEVNKLIDRELESEKYQIKDKAYHKIRCIFHPEYSNADFMGQIYPCVSDQGDVDYQFKPGPFAQIIRRAYLNPDKPFYLIIEEVNRGNAAAIFGDMFQLLDRIKTGEEPDKSTENTYDSGWSFYGVDNADINAYIRDVGALEMDQNDKIALKAQTVQVSEELDASKKHYRSVDIRFHKGKVHVSPNTAIRLPPNLFIYATMNTSDQNVFSLDNAFQRRFMFKMIPVELEDRAQFNIKIGDTGVCWGAFRDWINGKILSTPSIINAEDKRLGGWFISSPIESRNKDINAIAKYRDVSKEVFAEKVLKYLWNDVFKRNIDENVFKRDDKLDSLSKVVNVFKATNGFNAFEKIFVIEKGDKNELQKDFDSK